MKELTMTAKISLVAIACLLISLPGIAQQVNGETFSIPLSEPNKPGKLEFHLIDGSIKVLGHDSKEVQINAKRREPRKTQRTREGMKSITSNNLEYTVEELKNTVLIKAWPSGTIDFEIKVPKNFSLNIKTVNKGDIYVENVQGEFEVSNTNGAITMKDISGSVIADAMNKDIVVSFLSVSNNPMAFSNFNGDIDVTFPGNFKAMIKAKTQQGEIFTDFNLDLKSSDKPTVTKKDGSGVYKVSRNEWVSGTLNGGGQEVQFQTYNGDILIRNKDK